MTDRDPPITPETLSAFLESVKWWERNRKPLLRFAYRVVVQLAEIKAAERVNAAGRQKSWAARRKQRSEQRKGIRMTKIKFQPGTELYVITEWNRSATTVLTPGEY